MSARSRAYPWWRHMDPENGLLALARVGQAVASARAAELDPAIGGPWDVRRWQVPEDASREMRAMLDGFEPWPWWTAPAGFFDSLTLSPEPSAKSWSSATPEEIIADIESAAADVLEKMRAGDRPRYPMPVVQTASVPLTGLKRIDNDYVEVQVLAWEIGGTLYVHPERWSLVMEGIAAGRVESTKGVVDGDTFHVVASYGDLV